MERGVTGTSQKSHQWKWNETILTIQASINETPIPDSKFCGMYSGICINKYDLPKGLFEVFQNGVEEYFDGFWSQKFYKLNFLKKYFINDPSYAKKTNEACFSGVTEERTVFAEIKTKPLSRSAVVIPTAEKQSMKKLIKVME